MSNNYRGAMAGWTYRDTHGVVHRIEHSGSWAGASKFTLQLLCCINGAELLLDWSDSDRVHENASSTCLMCMALERVP